MQHFASMLFGLMLAAHAGDAPSTLATQRYEEGVSACTSQSDMDGQQCLADLLQPSEAELKRVYEAALKVAAAQGRVAELRRAQVAWAKFVEAQCQFKRAQFRGGTGYWSVAYICRIQQNAARVDDLGRGLGQ